jgi:DNA-binding winged helix-turn-helix (wHTH) protein
MLYRFAEFELDEEQRELRLRGQEIVLQPRVFDLLVYLVRNRERLVSKEELLDALWPGVIVVDSALQRVVSLARSALQQGGAEKAIRTYSRRGYRFYEEVATNDAASSPGEAPALERAHRAFQHGEWQDAIDRLGEVDSATGLEGVDLERWAHAEQCLGRLANAVPPLERAVAAHASVGDRRSAARAALALAQVQFEQGEIALAKGLHKRADSFLAGEKESTEHGTLEWLAARFAFGEGDFEEALRRSVGARAIGKRLRDADIEAMALLYQGGATLALGDPTRGIALQDEAAAAALAGEVKPLIGSLIYCGVIAGCRNHGDWERAAHWVEHFTRWCERSGLSAFPGTCRLYHGEVLSVRGRLAEAEKEINQACTELPMGAPWAAGDAYRVLGEIRLARNDLEGAEVAFRRAHELGWDPQPGYALLQVARGRAGAAVRGLERALEDQRWSNRQRRGLLLAYLVIVAQAAGQSDHAREALKELDEHPELWSAPALAATVERARAETALSEGRLTDAISSLRRGAQRWQEIGSPLNVASYRLRLAELLCGEGDYEAAELELSAASSLFRQAGVTARLRSCEQLRRSLSGTVD